MDAGSKNSVEKSNGLESWEKPGPEEREAGAGRLLLPEVIRLRQGCNRNQEEEKRNTAEALERCEKWFVFEG
jgi:hypothetical protein